MAKNVKKEQIGRKQFYCYLKAEDNGTWILFQPKHESAAALDKTELEMHLLRIMQFHKDTQKILCVKKSGKASKRLENLGCTPSRRQLQLQGLELYQLIEL